MKISGKFRRGCHYCVRPEIRRKNKTDRCCRRPNAEPGEVGGGAAVEQSGAEQSKTATLRYTQTLLESLQDRLMNTNQTLHI